MLAFARESTVHQRSCSLALQPVIAGLPDSKHVVVTGGSAPPGTINYAGSSFSTTGNVRAGSAHPDEPAFWLYSSGSTGTPKGASTCTRARWRPRGYMRRMCSAFREDDVCLSAAKLFFAYGLGNALTFPMSVGATTVLNAGPPDASR